jgi:ubiquinone/menaquinone biosynthesis C-methylase UbiE
LNRSLITEKQVKDANRQFYDAVADCYESVDGRRSAQLARWLQNRLTVIRNSSGGEKLLDIGTGSGFVTRCAKDIFNIRIGLDLSPKLLAANPSAFDAGIAADAKILPFPDDCFNAVTCFAVLHHLFSFDGLVSEIKRVLRPQGVLYSDHDMDADFRKRFRFPIWVYRKVRKAGDRYQKAGDQISPGLYRLSEWQEDGINTAYLLSLLRKNGFSVDLSYHWFGLSPLINLLSARGARYRKPGWAPLVSIVAKKSSIKE